MLTNKNCLHGTLASTHSAFGSFPNTAETILQCDEKHFSGTSGITLKRPRVTYGSYNPPRENRENEAGKQVTEETTADTSHYTAHMRKTCVQLYLYASKSNNPNSANNCTFLHVLPVFVPSEITLIHEEF